MASVIQLSAVTKAFTNGTKVTMPVLHGVDLSVAPGDFTAVTGRSGSGKSTLLSIMGLMDRPTKGKVTFQGRDTELVTDMELAGIRGRGVGFVFQQFHLLSRLSAVENVEMPMRYAGTGARRSRKAALEALRNVGLESVAYMRPPQLSGGQRQRVALARAIVINPPLILADEPTGSLDRESSAIVLKILKLLNQQNGAAIVLVTHDDRIAHEAKKVLTIEDGKLIAQA